jgi:squalene-hopene/tetraprenyl-beta-curcumene cyclase
MSNAPDLTTIASAYRKAEAHLLAARLPEGHWQGRLAPSAVSTAVAALAMSLHPEDAERLERAVIWLTNHQNADGGWGDTPESPSNLSAVLLARAALINSGLTLPSVRAARSDSGDWLSRTLGGDDRDGVVARVLSFYGSDLTFSAPILTVSMLSGSLGADSSRWASVPALPFELSLIPSHWFQFLRLPVVSYAIPALIAVGIAQTTHNPPTNWLLRRLRARAIKPALRRLTRLVPVHGGFLEAAPLTGFVAFCLGKSGYADHVIVRKGLQFLRSTGRPDGSWPIDTDLSTWLTSLAVKAVGTFGRFTEPERAVLVRYFQTTRTREPHVFTGAPAGGWSWTNLPGGVPDADDTAGALVALARLMPGDADDAVVQGLEWLLCLMNRDGGVPTFCRGWGYLPFDCSCPDISAHALTAFLLWRNRVPEPLGGKLDRAMPALLTYLDRSRDADGTWAPLWFGDQDAPNRKNRVYGTAVVLEALAQCDRHTVLPLLEPAVPWLEAAANADGGWGGEPHTPSKIETTAKAVSALTLLDRDTSAVRAGATYLATALLARAEPPKASPIGLYFASLWYDEELYPLIFSVSALGAVLKRAGNGKGGQS